MMVTPTSRREPLTLMTLPAEVREVIYQHIFSYRKPLYTARSGKLVINREARRDMQCLRTCVKFYCEAMPQIYAANTLEINYNQISALSCVPRHAEILVGRVVIHCYHPHHIDEAGVNVEDIDFGLLGQACPNVNSLDIYTYSSGSLLWITQQLSKSLPCSPIREWPLLQVDVVLTEDNPLFNNANFAKTRSGVIHGIATPGAGISWLDARSSFRLGYEIPRHLKSITVKGKLSKELCRTVLESHSCTFGDCSFQKKELARDTKLSTSNPTDPLAKKSATRGIRLVNIAPKNSTQSTKTYIDLLGEPIPLDEEHESNIMAAMNQWVPRLDQSEYENMAGCGYSVSPEKLGLSVATGLTHKGPNV